MRDAFTPAWFQKQARLNKHYKDIELPNKLRKSILRKFKIKIVAAIFVDNV